MKAKLPIRVFWALLAAMVCLLVLHLGLQYLNLSYNEKHGQIFELSNRLDVDDEASIPTWFSQLIWLTIALSSSLAYLLSKETSSKRTWMIVTLIGVFFSIDEVAGIHELLLQSLHLLVFGLQAPSSQLNAWWLVLPLIVACGWWFLRRLYSVLSLKNWLLMLGGWLLFVFGAFGLELYANDIPHNTFYYQGVITAIEEGLEMLGGIIVLHAVLSYLAFKHGKQLRKALSQLSSPSNND